MIYSTTPARGVMQHPIVYPSTLVKMLKVLLYIVNEILAGKNSKRLHWNFVSSSSLPKELGMHIRKNPINATDLSHFEIRYCVLESY